MDAATEVPAEVRLIWLLRKYNKQKIEDNGTKPWRGVLDKDEFNKWDLNKLCQSGWQSDSTPNAKCQMEMVTFNLIFRVNWDD